ncbi:hypothetical protein ACP70R_004351 [Stipagrostis hirtigluma subsp. patula]
MDSIPPPPAPSGRSSILEAVRRRLLRLWRAPELPPPTTLTSTASCLAATGDESTRKHSLILPSSSVRSIAAPRRPRPNGSSAPSLAGLQPRTQRSAYGVIMCASPKKSASGCCKRRPYTDDSVLEEAHSNYATDFPAGFNFESTLSVRCRLSANPTDLSRLDGAAAAQPLKKRKRTSCRLNVPSCLANDGVNCRSRGP